MSKESMPNLTNSRQNEAPQVKARGFLSGILERPLIIRAWKGAGFRPRKYNPIRRLALLIAGIVFILSPAQAEQFTHDGFSAAKKIQSRYFDIFVAGGVDLQTLAVKLYVPPSIRSVIREPNGFSQSYGLSDQLDILFPAVLEIMDIQLNNFKCDLKICRNGAQLAQIANSLFGQKLKPGGFYVLSINTLYIDAENVSLHVLGHELSHAIQAHYFVVPPPVKIQEILAGYVEFQLRKYTHTLPE